MLWNMSKIKVSIVEEDVQARQIWAEWFRASKDFECLGQYNNVKDALAQLPHESPNIVLIDINLLGGIGIECIRQLKSLLPKTHFIVFTVYEDTNSIFKILCAGASGYLLKLARCDELLAAMKSVHDRGAMMTGCIAHKAIRHFQSSPSYSDDNSCLTPLDHEILELLARGYLYREIAETLQISVAAVHSHIGHIYENLHNQATTKRERFEANVK
jgi:DNA-binding NarL/FixJ family response regulator